MVRIFKLPPSRTSRRDRHGGNVLFYCFAPEIFCHLAPLDGFELLLSEAGFLAE